VPHALRKGELRYTYGEPPTRYRFTGQAEEASLGLYDYGARWYDPRLGRFIQADSIVPGAGSPLAWDRYAYSYGNPVKYIDPDGHWPCVFSSAGLNCSVNTFGLRDTINRSGEKLGVENASETISGAMSTMGLVFDVVAGAFDFAASVIITAGIVSGAAGGAAITLPGGGTAVVTGAAGAGVGWVTAEIGVRPLILLGNASASVATLLTVSSELISGDTGFKTTLGISSSEIKLNSQVAVGSSSQVSIWATTAGWISPLAYPSLGIQTVAILGDLGEVSPPPISMGLAVSLPNKPYTEFRLKFGDVEVR
jgi:RHS repeat-associated protein